MKHSSERKVVRKFTLETEKLMQSLCLQTEPIKKRANLRAAYDFMASTLDA